MENKSTFVRKNKQVRRTKKTYIINKDEKTMELDYVELDQMFYPGFRAYVDRKMKRNDTNKVTVNGISVSVVIKYNPNDLTNISERDCSNRVIILPKNRNVTFFCGENFYHDEDDLFAVSLSGKFLNVRKKELLNFWLSDNNNLRVRIWQKGLIATRSAALLWAKTFLENEYNLKHVSYDGSREVLECDKINWGLKKKTVGSKGIGNVYEILTKDGKMVSTKRQQDLCSSINLYDKTTNLGTFGRAYWWRHVAAYRKGFTYPQWMFIEKLGVYFRVRKVIDEK